MDFNRFTEKLQEGVRSAQTLATARGQQQIEVEHLLSVLLAQEGGLMQSILTKAGVDAKRVHQKLEEELGRMPKVSGSAPGVDQVYVTKRLQGLLERAEKEAAQFKDDYVSVEHVVLAATSEKILRDLGVTHELILRTLQTIRKGQRVTSPNPEATYESLEKYGSDLTKLAAAGKLDPVIGRDDEIRRVVQVLSRRTKKDRKSTRLNSSH